jgi:hypothetical protein
MNSGSTGLRMCIVDAAVEGVGLAYVKVLGQQVARPHIVLCVA